MTFTAITITTDGSITVEHWRLTEQASTLAHLQAAYAGASDAPALAPGIDMPIPDEGTVDGSKPTAAATAAAHGHTGRPTTPPQSSPAALTRPGSPPPRPPRAARTCTTSPGA